MPTTRGRLVAPSQVIYDQADFFHDDGFTRVTGLTSLQVTLQLYLNNVLQGWALVDGASATDAQIVAGKVYFSPIVNGPYNVRWRPNAIGYWRLILIYTAGFQIVAQDYDVAPGAGSTAVTGAQGLHTSFVRPGGTNNDGTGG